MLKTCQDNDFNNCRSSTPAMSDYPLPRHQHLASGLLDEARTYLEELLRQDPDDSDLPYNLGLCNVDLGQLDWGIELLHRSLQLAPRTAYPWRSPTSGRATCRAPGSAPREP
ncbi:tetratricopeptide repeat protein [Methanothrix sp.]|jgi:tetratricopeptide (TPR) repeat protein|uniref:tetratricopeptide repeat protein n=2 Tax=Methanothrix sp. TaxID=90426 RepID=UPI0034528135